MPRFAVHTLSVSPLYLGSVPKYDVLRCHLKYKYPMIVQTALPDARFAITAFGDIEVPAHNYFEHLNC